MAAGDLFSEESVDDGGGACLDVESLDRRRGLVDVCALLSDEETGVGGGSRRPVVARWEARVESWDVADVRGADRGCTSQFWHLLHFVDERRLPWISSGAQKILVIHRQRAANAAQTFPRSKRKQLMLGAAAALNHTSYHLGLCLLYERRLLGGVFGMENILVMTE